MKHLCFELNTARYLGKREVAEICVELLSTLPKQYWPTKCRSVFSSPRPFSFKNPLSFFECVPGEFPYEGDVSLYKIKGIFEFWMFWSKGDSEWFENHPTKPFNSIGIVRFYDFSRAGTNPS